MSNCETSKLVEPMIRRAILASTSATSTGPGQYVFATHEILHALGGIMVEMLAFEDNGDAWEFVEMLYDVSRRERADMPESTMAERVGHA